MSRAVLDQACRLLICQLTRLPGITAGGALAVQPQITNSVGQLITTIEIPANDGVVCSLHAAGGRELTGSLLAIGAHPIPWA